MFHFLNSIINHMRHHDNQLWKKTFQWGFSWKMNVRSATVALTGLFFQCRLVCTSFCRGIIFYGSGHAVSESQGWDPEWSTPVTWNPRASLQKRPDTKTTVRERTGVESVRSVCAGKYRVRYSPILYWNHLNFDHPCSRGQLCVHVDGEGLHTASTQLSWS